MAKVYNVGALFHDNWKALPPKRIVQVYTLMLQLREAEPGSKRWGFLMIMVMRMLRKRPLLVDKMNEAQVVDCYHDLTFLHTGWHHFYPIANKLGSWSTPAEKLARNTFDQFIYADNEYSSFIVSQDDKYLKRLVATLYMTPFDKEAVDAYSNGITCKPWELTLVFFTYAHVRDFIMKRCRTLLPVSDEKTDRMVSTGPMWLKLKHRLAETPAFQGFDTAGRANMYSALDYLEDLAQQKDHAQP